MSIKELKKIIRLWNGPSSSEGIMLDSLTAMRKVETFVSVLEQQLADLREVGPCPRKHLRQFWVPEVEINHTSETAGFVRIVGHCTLCLEIDREVKAGEAVVLEKACGLKFKPVDHSMQEIEFAMPEEWQAAIRALITPFQESALRERDAALDARVREARLEGAHEKLVELWSAHSLRGGGAVALVELHLKQTKEAIEELRAAAKPAAPAAKEST